MARPSKKTYALQIGGVRYTAIHIHWKASKIDLVLFSAIDEEGRPVNSIDDFTNDGAIKWRISLNAMTHNEGYDRVIQFPHTGVVAIQGWSSRRDGWDASIAVVMTAKGFVRDVDIMEPLKLRELKRLIEVRRRLNRGERVVLSE